MDLSAALVTFQESSAGDRKQFLMQILQCLYPSERSLLYGTLVATSIGYDILGSLPLELVLKIVEFVDAREVFLFRRVCKRWHQVLSSESVAGFGVNRWFPTEADVAVYPLLPHARSNKRSRLRDLVFREQAAANGMFLKRGDLTLSSSRLINNDNNNDGDSAVESVILGERWMVVATRKRLLLSDMTNIKDTKPLVTPSRESIAKAALGSDHVVAVSFHLGTCHLWDLNGKHIHKWRLSSGNVQEIAVSANYVALISSEPSKAGELHVHVLEIKTRRAFSSAIPLAFLTTANVNKPVFRNARIEKRVDQGIFIDEERGHIVILHARLPESIAVSNIKIKVTRFCCALRQIVSEREVEIAGDGRFSLAAQQPRTDWRFSALPGTYSCAVGELLGGETFAKACCRVSDSSAWIGNNVDNVIDDNDTSPPFSENPVIRVVGPKVCYRSVEFALGFQPSPPPTAAGHVRGEFVEWKLYNRHPRRRSWKKCTPTVTIASDARLDEPPNIVIRGRFLVGLPPGRVCVFEIPDYDTHNSLLGTVS